MTLLFSYNKNMFLKIRGIFAGYSSEAASDRERSSSGDWQGYKPPWRMSSIKRGM